MSTHGLIPVHAIADEVWRRLDRAANDRTNPMRLMTLATVAADGRPGARLMVVRGFEREAVRVWFHTDRGTPKAAEIRANPSVCLVAYDPRDGVQLRLSGQAALHESDSVAQRHWEQTTTALRFLSASPDAAAADAIADPRLRAAQADLEHAHTRRARALFEAIEVRVETIDWYQAGESHQRRAVLHKSSQWRPEALS